MGLNKVGYLLHISRPPLATHRLLHLHLRLADNLVGRQGASCHLPHQNNNLEICLLHHHHHLEICRLLRLHRTPLLITEGTLIHHLMDPDHPMSPFHIVHDTVHTTVHTTVQMKTVLATIFPDLITVLGLATMEEEVLGVEGDRGEVEDVVSGHVVTVAMVLQNGYRTWI